MNVSYQYNKKAGKSIRLLSFTCNQCNNESIVEFKGQGKYTCTTCGWKIELVKEWSNFSLQPLSLPLSKSNSYKLPKIKKNAV